ncbi:MAG: DNA cytosine methyltransferase [Kiritimatiellae bacterium]|nr:DNA cytosine methyltransferase [Kiritimatiellia bacterium]
MENQSDARRINYSEFAGVNLIAGGPPCQPFSLGGKHRGKDDQRNMFPEAVRAVRELTPKVFVFENVKGGLWALPVPYEHDCEAELAA